MATNFEEMKAEEQKRIIALDTIGLELEKYKDAAVSWRAQFEMQWTLDYLQYNTSARTGMGPTKREGTPPRQSDEAEYRQTADNITRPKVIITAARMGDMLFPTNDANWDLEPSPRPDIPDDLIPPPPPSLQQDPQTGEQVQGPPTPYTPEQIEGIKREIAAKRCDSMRTTIKDQLAESHYDEHGRAIIFDACLYGTGVLRGPVLKNRRKHTYGSHSQAQPPMVQAAKPTVEHVDLWSFFPQPARSIEECEHAFRLHILPKRGLRQLAYQPGFDRGQIVRLLESEPRHGALITSIIDRGALRPDMQMVLTDRYSVYEYRGPMPKEAMAAYVENMVAQQLIDMRDAAGVLNEMERDHLSEIDCEVWFSQGIVIKMALSTLAPGELGYYVYNYEKDPNAIFGHGVAYLCRDDQHAVNQLWHALMLNSMMSAGPQIGVRKNAVYAQPGDSRANTFAADRPRVWALTDDAEDINKAFSVFTIPNVTKEVLGLYERAKQNADEHTMTPLIAQGEPTQAAPTSSGTAMLMNAANVVMRRLAKGYDDDITIPMLGAHYDWNMSHSQDESIRGDYCVIAKGASHLLIKDVMTQHIQFATQLFSTNPVLAEYMKAKKFADKNMEMLDLKPDDYLYTEDEVKQAREARGEQPDPDTIKAQAALETAKAATARAQIEADSAKHKMQWEREERAIAHKERMADIEARQRIQALQLEGQKMSIVQAMSQMESKERIEFQKIVADLTKHGATVDLGQYSTDQRAALDAERIASEEARQAEEIKAEKSSDAKVQ